MAFEKGFGAIDPERILGLTGSNKTFDSPVVGLGGRAEDVAVVFVIQGLDEIEARIAAVEYTSNTVLAVAVNGKSSPPPKNPE